MALAFVDVTGSAAVEFASLFAIFAGMVLVAALVSVLYMAKSQLDYTAQKVARQVMTGQVTSQSQLQSAICSNTTGLLSCSSIMANLTSYSASQLDSITTSTPTLSYGSDGSVSNTWNTQFGAAGSIMVLQLMYQYPIISGELFSFATQSNGTYLIVSNAVFVNE